MPAKGKSRVTPKQRAKIVAGRLAGKTHKQIAQETGLAPVTVRRQATDERSRGKMQILIERKQPELDRGWEFLVKWLLKDLNSSDATIRAQARRDFGRLISLGDAPLARLLPPSEAPPGSMLLEEALLLYRKFELAKIPPPK